MNSKPVPESEVKPLFYAEITPPPKDEPGPLYARLVALDFDVKATWPILMADCWIFGVDRALQLLRERRDAQKREIDALSEVMTCPELLVRLEHEPAQTLVELKLSSYR